MTRNDFKEIARERLQDATVLFAARRYSAAYYLAGYVIECALKACIARKTRRYEFPDKKTAQDSHIHDLTKLATVAGLKAQLDGHAQADPQFADNWSVVKAWEETSRYERRAKAEAEALIDAVKDPAHGVLTWIEQAW